MHRACIMWAFYWNSASILFCSVLILTYPGSTFVIMSRATDLPKLTLAFILTALVCGYIYPSIIHPLMTTVHHLLMATSSRILHHVTELISSQTGFLNMTMSSLDYNGLQSPDLNPIEHLWDVVECKIRIIDVHPTNLQQLRDAVMSIWKISEQCFQHLVESMPRIIKTVLKAKGGPTFC